MKVTLHIDQAIGRAYIIRPDGQIHLIKPGSRIKQNDIITTRYQQNAWLITSKNQQLDIIDTVFLLSKNNLITLSFPTDKKALLDSITQTLNAYQVNSLQRHALLNLRFDTLLSAQYKNEDKKEAVLSHLKENDKSGKETSSAISNRPFSQSSLTADNKAFLSALHQKVLTVSAPTKTQTPAKKTSSLGIHQVSKSDIKMKTNNKSFSSVIRSILATTGKKPPTHKITTKKIIQTKQSDIKQSPLVQKGDLQKTDEHHASGTLSEPHALTPLDFKNEKQEGLFGFLTIKDKTWHYTLLNTAIENLPENEIANDHFVIQAKNNKSFNFVISLTGTDKLPVVFGNITGPVAHSDPNKLTGQAQDFLSEHQTSLRFADLNIEAQYGNFIMENNTWTYTLNPYLLSFLAYGDTRYEPISLSAEDNSTHLVFISIIGTHDDPILHMQSSNDAHIFPLIKTASGIFMQRPHTPFTDLKRQKYQGLYGECVVWGTHWCYALTDKTIDLLKEKEMVSDTILIESKDAKPLTLHFSIRNTKRDNSNSLQNLEQLEITCEPQEFVSLYEKTPFFFGDIKQLTNKAILEHKQSQSQYGEFTLSNNSFVYQLHSELVCTLEKGMTLCDQFFFFDSENKKHRIQFQFICTENGIAFEAVLSKGLSLCHKPKEKDAKPTPLPIGPSAIYQKTTYRAKSNSPTSLSSPDVTFNQSEQKRNVIKEPTLLIERIQYPSVSGRIHFPLTKDKNSIFVPKTELEGKYGKFSIEQTSWVYTFSPDKILPYSAETRETLVIQDDRQNAHQIIITIESGMKKPIITDILITSLLIEQNKQ